MGINVRFKRVYDSFKAVLSAWRNQPALIKPFFVTGLAYAVSLTIVFLSPRPPLLKAMGPIIRAFWGEQYLHYPYNFFILPNLFDYGKNTADFFIGVLMSGTAVAMLAQVYQKGVPSFWGGFAKSIRRFFRLVLLWAITFTTIVIALKLFQRFLSPLFASKELLIGSQILLATLIQMVFLYTFPAVIIENRKIYMALKRSFALTKIYAFETFVILLLPTLLSLPVLAAIIKLPWLMKNFSPEVTLYVLSARIVVTLLIDIIVLSAVTYLFIEHRKTEKENVE